MDKVILRQWLKAGFLEKDVLFATTEGTPQGGISSPALANRTLDGLQALLAERFGATRRQRQRNKVHLVRYADDCAPRRREGSDYRVCSGTPCRVRDEGRSLGIGLQDQIPNHLKLLGSKALVVSVQEKAGLEPVRYGPRRRTQVNRR